jgi:phage tail-like protein
MSSAVNIPSSYIDYLPAVLQEDPFLGQFLLAFEAILSGVSLGDVSTPIGFETTLENIHIHFSATHTPEDFLHWLAGWVALSLRDDWEVKVKRNFIQQIIPLYRQRGTPAALSQMLKIYLQKQVNTVTEYVAIYEFDQIPHYFQVQLRLDSQDLAEYRRKESIARAIIEQEKPAHTIYGLQILMPTMRLVSTAKLRQEGLLPEQIFKRRLRLFSSSQSPDFREHQNKTVLGTTDEKPS